MFYIKNWRKMKLFTRQKSDQDYMELDLSN